jgi:tetratricopeptide (TPR) repeat protein
MRRWARLHPAIAAASVLAFTAIAGVATAAAASHEAQAARLFREGRQAYARQDYTSAVEKLGQSLELQSDPQVLLVRGRAYQRLNNLDDAVTDYERANALMPSPEGAAAAAYAHNLRFEHERAASLYQQVIALGCADSVVYNNLGLSLLQMNRDAEAQPYFDLAIRHDPSLQAAYYNRAMADYQNHLRSKISQEVEISLPLFASSGPLGTLAALHVGLAETVPNNAIRDMNMAIRIGPAVAELYRWKAEMCAYASLRDTYYFEPMCQAIEMAIREGQPGSTFRDESPLGFYNPFATRPRFQKAKSAVPVKASPQHIERFLEPSVAPVAKARTPLPAG